MTEVNKHGLSRNIPADIKREIRKRSKFGCVICRQGFYTYEHIDPPFANATEHDPSKICCLCGTCHLAVTREQYSKEYIKSSYAKIQQQTNIAPPSGPLDFHDGTAELLIGSLMYSPAVKTVLRYYGYNLISVKPGKDGEQGSISAVFTDSHGAVALQLIENEWIGSLDAWDIDVVGPRITVRREKGDVVLKLRLDPPGCLVIEHLDMRFRSCHILASEKTYAIGRYIDEENIFWVHVKISIHRSSPTGAAIEITDPETLEIRDLFLRSSGPELSTYDRNYVASDNGIMLKNLGIVIASMCGGLREYGSAAGLRELSQMRKVVFNEPEKLLHFIGTGQFS
jgi:hypothetical protein